VAASTSCPLIIEQFHFFVIYSIVLKNVVKKNNVYILAAKSYGARPNDEKLDIWDFGPWGRKKCVVSLILVKKVSLSLFVQQMFKNYQVLERA
jgi:hypothetical protein